MKRRFIFCLALLTSLASLPVSAETPADWKSLFDGSTFTGWEGDLSKFRIEDGAIVAGGMQTPLDRNYFLCTTERYGNFELELKVKLVGEDANAGIQIRTERIPNDTEVIGYQADMGQQYWGCLYDESRRKRVLQQPARELIEKTLKKGDWNEYRIRCEGKHIQLWLNGVQTVDYTETEAGIAETGIIAVQIHSGKPAEASYKDIRIRELPTVVAGKKYDVSLRLLDYPVAYDSIVQQGPSILPALYEILDDKNAGDYWIGAVCAIGYLGKQPGSREALNRFLLNPVKPQDAKSFRVSDELTDKNATIHTLGLISGPEDVRFLQELLADRTKAEALCLRWNPEFSVEDLEFMLLTADVQQRACFALILSRQDDCIAFAKSFVEKLKQEAADSALYEKDDTSMPREQVYLKYILIGLDSVMTSSALIDDKGIEHYFRLQTNPQAFANAILPYVFEENGIPFEGGYISVD